MCSGLRSAGNSYCPPLDFQKGHRPDDSTVRPEPICSVQLCSDRQYNWHSQKHRVSASPDELPIHPRAFSFCLPLALCKVLLQACQVVEVATAVHTAAAKTQARLLSRSKWGSVPVCSHVHQDWACMQSLADCLAECLRSPLLSHAVCKDFILSLIERPPFRT